MVELKNLLEWKTEKRKLSELSPSIYNPRKFSEPNKKNLSTSLEKFNLAEPIVINTDNTIIGGHFRYKILTEKYGRNGTEIDVRVPTRNLTTEEEKELNLRLNRNLGEWDFDLLGKIDVSMLEQIGFDSNEIDKAMIEFPNDQDDAVLPIPKKAKSKRGEIYQLGKHRLMCGDSTEKKDVEKLMQGKKANLVSTDPPYCVDYTGDNRPGGGKDWSEVYHEISPEDPLKFLTIAAENTADTAAWYVWHSEKIRTIFLTALEKAGIHVAQTIIWVKGRKIPGYLPYQRQYEPCLFGWKKGFKPKTYQRYADMPSDVWQVLYDDNKKAKIGKSHPTQKPVELFSRPMIAHTQRGDICLDLFAGSGTSFIAAEKNNRICYGMEIEPVFCDVIRERYEIFTGKN